MDLLDLLDDILAAERGTTVHRHVAVAVSWFPCGVHQRARDDERHLAECWGHTCPSCGEHVGNGFLMGINHDGAESGLCTSVRLRLNHCTASFRMGDVEASERDLSVIELGYRFGPDGSQIHPGGRVDPVLNASDHGRLFGRWAA